MSGLAPSFDLLQSRWPVLAATDEVSRRTLNVVAPYDGQPIAQVAVASDRHVQDALFAAFSMYRQKDRWLSPLRRIAVLTQALELIEDNADLLATEAARESGKALRWCVQEVDQACEDATEAIAQLREKLAEDLPVGPLCGMQPEATRVRFGLSEPAGVVVVVLGRDSPLQLAARFLFAAVAAGCPVIIKPAEDVPLSCLRLVHLLHEAGLPYVWCQSVVTETHEVTRQLISDPRVALFSFCGSSDVGWNLRAQLAPGTRALLDHGSVVPAVVALDADLELAAATVVAKGLTQRMPNSDSVQRVFVPDKISEAFLQAVQLQAERIVSGDPLLPQTEHGPLVRPTDPDRVQQWVDAAVAGGGRIVSGGVALGHQGYAPTIVLNPPLDAQMSTQPACAPVLAVYTLGSLEEACERANALPLARGALVFTNNASVAAQLSRALDATQIGINERWDERFSQSTSSGLRRSGLGELGFDAACTAMQIRKSVDVRAWIEA